MFIKGVRLEVVFFFTIIGVIAPLLHRMPISCRTGLTRGFFLTKPPPVFFASDDKTLLQYHDLGFVSFRSIRKRA